MSINQNVAPAGAFDGFDLGLYLRAHFTAPSADRHPQPAMTWRQQLIGVPVRIVSHAGPAYRGRIGPVVSVSGTFATIDLSTSGYLERVCVDLRGLSLIQKKKTPEVACSSPC